MKMRKFYIDIPSWGPAYCSAKRYVIEIGDDERIAGVNMSHYLVVVVTKKESFAEAEGIMPRAIPMHQVWPDRFSTDYIFPLNVFRWTDKFGCRYENTTIMNRDSRAPVPIMARAKYVQRCGEEIYDQIGDYDWSPLPVEDLDPKLTSREEIIEAILPPL
jgi:hypothetical protein